MSKTMYLLIGAAMGAAVEWPSTTSRAGRRHDLMPSTAHGWTFTFDEGRRAAGGKKSASCAVRSSFTASPAPTAAAQRNRHIAGGQRWHPGRSAYCAAPARFVPGRATHRGSPCAAEDLELVLKTAGSRPVAWFAGRSCPGCCRRPAIPSPPAQQLQHGAPPLHRPPAYPPRVPVGSPRPKERFVRIDVAHAGPMLWSRSSSVLMLAGSRSAGRQSHPR